MAAFTVIDHTELTGDTSSYNVTSIPSSYDHLFLEVSVRSTYSSTNISQLLTFNGNTGSNYKITYIYAYGSTAGGSSWAHSDGLDIGAIAGAGLTANTFSVAKVWIPHYANTANFKQMIALGAVETATGSGERITVTSGLWSATPAAINQITLTPYTGEDYLQYSTFTLYGVTA